MSGSPLPGHEQQPDEIMCSSCGRFVGALTRCPHCGARVQKRLSIRVCRYAALVLGTVGLGLLYLMTTHREIPLVRIGDIRPSMNFAYVRVVGTVSSDARIFKEGDKPRSLRFMVDDGSGEISVTAYRSQAETLVSEDRVPRVGDRVEVAGALGMAADDSVVLRLQVPSQLMVTRSEVPITPLGVLAADQAGESVRVEGTIVDVSPPRPGSRAPWTVKIRDPTGEGVLTFWEDVYAEIRDKILLMKGSPVVARVAVRTYRGDLQLSLGRGTDLEFPQQGAARTMTAGPGAPGTDVRTVAVADLSPDLAGEVVSVSGRVKGLREPAPGSRAPYQVTLQDGDAEVTVVYWDVVARHLAGNRPVVGALMTVRGQVDVYRDKVQLKVSHSGQIMLVDVAPAAAAPAPSGIVEIAAVTAAMTGQTVTVKGALGEARSIKGGVIYPMSDGTASIQLLLWDRSVPGVDRDGLSLGVHVTVTGEIREYRGELEIVPASSRALRIE